MQLKHQWQCSPESEDNLRFYSQKDIQFEKNHTDMHKGETGHNSSHNSSLYPTSKSSV